MGIFVDFAIHEEYYSQKDSRPFLAFTLAIMRPLNIIIHSILWPVFLALALMAPVTSLQASNGLAIRDIQTIPATLVDSQVYSLSFFVINTDPAAPFNGEVSIQMQVDGEAPFELSPSVAPDFSLAPGDSFEISIPNYSFPAYRFRGTSVTHDIIVWPMRLGTANIDSAAGQVVFVHTAAMSSSEIGLATPVGLPGEVAFGETYDLSFDVINKDPDHYLYHPVSIVYTVDEEGPYTWIEDFELATPLAPGEQLTLTLPEFVFATSRHGASSVTHDIIVWPMAQFIDSPDPASIPVVFLPQMPEVGSNLDNGAGSPAPLISDFGITPKGDTEVSFDWATQYEALPGQFTIQPLSNNGPSPKPIGTYAHQGNPELGATYTYTLPRPQLEAAIYQLLYTTDEGMTFALATAELAPYAGPRMILSGNPIQDKSFLRVWVEHEGPSVLAIYDQGGRLVHQHQQMASTGWLHLDLPLMPQPEGIYYYRLSQGTQQYTGTLMRE